MNTNELEKIYLSATTLQKRADKMQQSILREYGVDWYEDIPDELARTACEKLSYLSGGIEEYREFIENNDL